MPRILMVLDHSYPPDIRVENEAESLTDAGFDVTILAIGPDDRAREDGSGRVRIIRDRIPARVRNKMRGLAGSVPVLSHYIARRSSAIHASWPFDVIHAHDLYMVGGALRAGRRLGVKVVADLHENWVAALQQYVWSTRFPGRLFANSERWTRLERSWLTQADATIVVIEEMAERLAALKIQTRDLAVVPNTIQRSRFDAYAIDATIAAGMKSDLTLLYTGGMDQHRGIGTAIEAMPRILKSVPGARLVLVGDGAVRPSLEALSTRLGLEARVDFRGWQPQERVPSYIAGADVGLIPHLKSEHTDHTIPHKLFHYMYMGIPVVSSDCRPLDRIISATDAGRIYPSGNHDLLADTVLDLARDAAFSRRLGDNGKKAVADMFHWEKTAVELTNLYNRIL